MKFGNRREQLQGEDEQLPHESPVLGRGLPAMNILVADDSKTNLFLLQEILKGRGYRVVTAINGVEALEKARQSPPDLIITDILMPVMDGLSLCREWKRDERLKLIPLVFYTGTYTDDRDREFALKLGAERFIVNTGNPEDLINVIREVLETRKRSALAATSLDMEEEAVYLKQHNESLTRKLEDKMRQLEQANRELQRDIAERRQQEQKIAKLSRIQAVLSGINAAIVRVRDREELLKEACRIAVEHGGFGIIWISELDPATLDVTRVAWAGSDAGEPTGGWKSTARADIREGQGVIGRAIREETPAVCNDIAADPNVGSGKRAEAIRRGYRSIIALPLFVEGTVWGTLTLYAKELDYFTDEEVKLLTELAGNISFALEHLHKQEKLDYLAYHDVLTGLPNRVLFDDRLKQQMRSASHDKSIVALVLVDLERFQVINDTFGQHAADGLLKLVAARLDSVMFDRDSLARVHSDVFAVLLPRVADEAGVARIVEEKIMGCLISPFALDGHELRVSARVGVALFPGDAMAPDALFSSAEAALSQAKASNERYLFYAPKMNARVAERLTLETKLRQAVEREQFVLYYQPKIDLHGKSVTGLEALIRWNDPEQGLVLPELFIPLLEETGMIVEVGAWVLKQAVSQYAAWRAAGMRPPRIAVNVSQLQLNRKDFVAMVQQAIAAAGDAEHGLDLEITESMIMEDVEASIEKLKAVRELGVEIAIDDFGTGYSSLQYIARLPISASKIDRAFVQNMTTNANDMSLVSTIISLAHNLDLKVIAEGVETEEQSMYLRLHKCDEAQGFLFSKPVPAAQVPSMLRSVGKPAA